jgi:hypothetical protein
MPDVNPLTAVCNGIAAALDSLSDSMQVFPTIKTSPTPPAIMVDVSDTEYDQSMGRAIDYEEFTVWALVTGTEAGNQINLHELMASYGDRSVKRLLDVDRTFGGTCIKSVCSSRTGTRRYTGDGKGPYLGCEWTVRVWLRGKAEA